MKNLAAIKQYFGEGHNGRKCSMDELKALSKDEKDELGKAACAELGEPHES